MKAVVCKGHTGRVVSRAGWPSFVIPEGERWFCQGGCNFPPQREVDEPCPQDGPCHSKRRVYHSHLWKSEPSGKPLGKCGRCGILRRKAGGDS